MTAALAFVLLDSLTQSAGRYRILLIRRVHAGRRSADDYHYLQYLPKIYVFESINNSMRKRAISATQFLIRKWAGLIILFVGFTTLGILLSNTLLKIATWTGWPFYVGSMALAIYTVARLLLYFRSLAQRVWQAQTPPFEVDDGPELAESYPVAKQARRRALQWFGMSYVVSVVAFFPLVSDSLWGWLSSLEQSVVAVNVLFSVLQYSTDLLNLVLVYHSAGNLSNRTILILIFPVLIPMLLCVKNATYAIEATCQQKLDTTTHSLGKTFAYATVLAFLSVNFVFLAQPA
jgi:hypothetical protein